LPPPQPEIPSSSTKTSSTTPYDGPQVELAEYLAYVEVIRELSDGLGVKFAIVCPWVEEHGAAIVPALVSASVPMVACGFTAITIIVRDEAGQSFAAAPHGGGGSG
jgi:hypothetical protein